ncbi:hypothetical protein ASPSYDRAFT_1020088 [Aspergillus sydowii CBS 593.65]|uniref:Uncharacterized protein n=1 Tax=Aspergillus sydowii CBS 593.65 TaxID=1036612 RepID=A0A1L9TEY3_9EURO|nr:uncharacterized protein ASPSYDRAFT_1020088 [Aspergillus sydowii CBS 593.65]OJJ57986.1 hypothetical protein ASPSYDRAFT_1020088 [Aspergillus sydowii CBS 593.65]
MKSLDPVLEDLRCRITPRLLVGPSALGREVCILLKHRVPRQDTRTPKLAILTFFNCPIVRGYFCPRHYLGDEFHWKDKGFQPYTQKMVQYRAIGLENWRLERPHTETEFGRSSILQLFVAVTCGNTIPMYPPVVNVVCFGPCHLNRRPKSSSPSYFETHQAGYAIRTSWVGLLRQRERG